MITTYDRFKSSPKQRLYIAIDPKRNVVCGILKVEERKIFYMDGMGTKELNPLCVLDFYVHESL